MRYRKLNLGEIIKRGDVIFSSNGRKLHFSVHRSIGDPVRMYGYFRRPLKSKVVAKTANNSRIKRGTKRTHAKRTS